MVELGNIGVEPMNFSELSHKAIQATKPMGNDFNNVSYSVSKDELPQGYNIHDNPELEKAYEYIKQKAPVVFLTGGAGTGKSTFIKYLKNNLKNETGKNCIVLAPTGVAAINVGGQTIHSFFSFPFDPFENKKITIFMKNPVVDHTDLIIIDEISMVRSCMLDHIDYALRLWCNKYIAFGGKQLLLIGDCFQLPPITNAKDLEAKKFYGQWESPFFFAANVFKDIDVQCVQLKKIYRQKDDERFIHMLNRIRKCKSGYENDVEVLNEKCFIETRLGTKNVPEECLLLTTKNAIADEFNTKKMYNLRLRGAKTNTYKADIKGTFNLTSFPTPQTLELCIGAKVMVTKNIKDERLVNGDMGRVCGFGGTGAGEDDYVDVEVKGNRHRLHRETWQSFRYKWDEKNKTIEQIPSASFNQIPLRLGWAVTIHKSQGLTLDAVAIDAADAWDSGQVYVALSRAKGLDGILLCQKIPSSSVKIDPYIKQIYEQMFSESDEEDVGNIEDDYKNITFDNSIFTVDKTKEKTSVTIGGINFELFPRQGEKIQQHVQRTMELLLSKHLIPAPEMKRLLTDEEYCDLTFNTSQSYNHSKIKFSFLKTQKSECYDKYGYTRYWADKYGGYYICRQWYPNRNQASKFAQWLIALSEGKLDKDIIKDDGEKKEFPEIGTELNQGESSEFEKTNAEHRADESAKSPRTIEIEKELSDIGIKLNQSELSQNKRRAIHVQLENLRLELLGQPLSNQEELNRIKRYKEKLKEINNLSNLSKRQKV